jgi:hypothetical protein
MVFVTLKGDPDVSGALFMVPIAPALFTMP